MCSQTNCSIWLAIGYFYASNRLVMGCLWACYQLSIAWLLAAISWQSLGNQLANGWLLAGYRLAIVWLSASSYFQLAMAWISGIQQLAISCLLADYNGSWAGYGLAINWLFGYQSAGYQLAIRWLSGGYQLATSWLSTDYWLDMTQYQYTSRHSYILLWTKLWTCLQAIHWTVVCSWDFWLWLVIAPNQ